MISGLSKSTSSLFMKFCAESEKCQSNSRCFFRCRRRLNHPIGHSLQALQPTDLQTLPFTWFSPFSSHAVADVCLESSPSSLLVSQKNHHRRRRQLVIHYYYYYYYYYYYFNVSSLYELFDTVNAQNILGFITDIGLYRLL